MFSWGRERVCICGGKASRGEEQRKRRVYMYTNMYMHVDRKPRSVCTAKKTDNQFVIFKGGSRGVVHNTTHLCPLSLSAKKKEWERGG